MSVGKVPIKFVEPCPTSWECKGIMTTPGERQWPSTITRKYISGNKYLFYTLEWHKLGTKPLKAASINVKQHKWNGMTTTRVLQIHDSLQNPQTTPHQEERPLSNSCFGFNLALITFSCINVIFNKIKFYTCFPQLHCGTTSASFSIQLLILSFRLRSTK